MLAEIIKCLKLSNYDWDALNVISKFDKILLMMYFFWPVISNENLWSKNFNSLPRDDPEFQF